MKQMNVMRATLGRLPVYLEYLKSLDLSVNENISATIIAKALGLGEVQVRKDLSTVSGAGRPKLGYKTKALIKRLEDVLGRKKVTKAVIVGAGKLGKALYAYGGFGNYGLEVAAAFDSNSEITGTNDSGKDILPLNKLEEYCIENGVKIGIITVPAHAAQDICNRMTNCGITAIWNFAPCQLCVPEGITLQNENLALSLAHLKLQMDCQ